MREFINHILPAADFNWGILKIGCPGLRIIYYCLVEERCLPAKAICRAYGQKIIGLKSKLSFPAVGIAVYSSDNGVDEGKLEVS